MYCVILPWELEEIRGKEGKKIKVQIPSHKSTTKSKDSEERSESNGTSPIHPKVRVQNRVVGSNISKVGKKNTV